MATIRAVGLLLVKSIGCAPAGSAREPAPASHLFLIDARSQSPRWAGDDDNKASDLLAVLDADPSSPRYGTVVASIPTGTSGSHPHHTEHDMPANGHLLANGFHAGQTWLFDLNQPLQPKILGSFGDVGGYSHPHTFVRLANGHVLATFQYRAEPGVSPHPGGHDAAPPASQHSTGGLVEMNETGRAIRSGSIGDRPGVRLTGKAWPHGFTGKAVPHGTVFSR